jgi:putative membrane protein
VPAPTNTTHARLLCAVILVPSLLVGCGKGAANRNAGGTDTTAAAASAPAAGATTSAAAAPTGTAANPAMNSWSDSNIVAWLEAGDKNEVQLGKLAEAKAIIPGVREFAKELVTDHSKSERDVRALATKAKVTARPANNDSTLKNGEDLLKKFTAMPKGTDWDSTFVQHEADEHQHDIADARALQNQTKDPQLKQLIADELPVLQKHLDDAQKLLGNTPGGTAAWHNAEFRKTEPSKKSARTKP